MPVRIQESEWRQKRWDWHGRKTFSDMQRKFPNRQTFNIRQVADLPALDHLADSTAYDVATAICRELEVQKKLKRQGRMMYLRNVKLK